MVSAAAERMDHIIPDSVDDHDGAVGHAPKRAAAEIEPQTPQLRPTKRKKVRFSDPGPQRESTDTHPDASTGITPQVSRTSIRSSDVSSPSTSTGARRTARKRGRRHTAPVAYHCDGPLNLESSPSVGPSPRYQYLHMDDRIDKRTMRSIRRFGLSEGMNKIEAEERAKKKKEKEREQELTRLREQLSLFVNAAPTAGGALSERESETAPTRRRLFHRPAEDIETPGGSVFHSPMPWSGDCDVMDSDGNSIMLDDDTTAHNSALDTPITTYPTTPTDASAQASLPDLSREAELQKLNEELERDRLEKQRFFREWQATVRSENLEDTIDDPNTESRSPPPDLTKQVITTLKAAAARASTATNALRGVHQDLSNHGFDGADAAETMANISAYFRHARMELEHAVPGETPQGDFSNWKDITEALVRRLKCLVRDVRDVREEMTGCESRETAIRHQFDATLERLEDATRKNTKLEKYSESVAEDMLHARMKLQALEREKDDQESDKVRLQEALEKYREDVKMLEQLNSQLEDEVAAFECKVSGLQGANTELTKDNESCRHIIVDLRQDLLHEQEARLETQSCLDQRGIDISDLQAKLQQLEAEKHEIVSALEQAAKEQSQHHEQEVGMLNARLSAITTSLDEVIYERNQLLENKGRLERRLGDFQKLLTQAQTLLEKDRDGDTEPDDDSNHDEEVQNRQSFSTIGGEPITPATESRFKNVVFARGKKRRRPAVDTVPEEVENAEAGT